MPLWFTLHRFHDGKRKFVGRCHCTAVDLAWQLRHDFPQHRWTIDAAGDVTVY